MDDRLPLGRSRGRGRGLPEQRAGQAATHGPPAGGGVPLPSQVSQMIYRINGVYTEIHKHESNGYIMGRRAPGPCNPQRTHLE